MFITNKKLVDLDGTAIMAGSVELTVAVVLVNCALTQPAPNEKPHTKTEVASRYELAMRANKLAIDESIEVDIALMAKLQDDLLRIYATIVSGQMLPLMDGKPGD